MMQTSENAYRTAAASGATWIGATIMVYDNLAADLLRAGQAAARNNIEQRCARSTHALLLLAHLESWSADLGNASLSASLNRFYATVRGKVLELQQGGTEQDFQALANLVCDTRAAWQQKEQMLTQQGQAAAVRPDVYGGADFDGLGSSSRSSMWSA